MPSKIEYPYLPEGKEIKFVLKENIFLKEAQKTSLKGCIIHPTGAVLVKDNKIIGRGNNGGKNITICPRREHKKSKTGENYDLCKTICGQKGHAETMAIKDAKKKKNNIEGADLYLYGHWWCCKDCWDAMIGAGVGNVYLEKNAYKKFK